MKLMRKRVLLAAGAMVAMSRMALAGPPTTSLQFRTAKPAPPPSLGERLAAAFTDPQLLLYLGFTLLATALFLMSRGKVRRWARWGMLLSSLAVLGFYFGGCPCPVGSATKLGQIFTNPVAYLVPFILFLIPTLVALFVGRIFCGWVCPLGAVQEVLGFWSRKKSLVPEVIDRRLRYLKYLLLMGLVALAILGVRFHWVIYDPFKVMFTGTGTWIAIGLAAFFGVLSLVIYRPWCRYVCPLGAVLALASVVGMAPKKADPKKCVGCALCARACPLDAIRIRNGEAYFTSECIRCGDCSAVCRHDALP